jgi:DUF3046 family protein
VPAREAGRPCELDAPRNLGKFSHVIAGHPVVTLPQQNYAHSSLFVTNVIRGPCGLAAWGAGWVIGWRRAGLLPGAGTLAGRTDRRSRARAGPGGQSSGRTVRLSEFWTRMRAQFGDAYAASVAKDHVLAALGERTVDQALADGVDAKTVWRAVCAEFDVPQRLR